MNESNQFQNSIILVTQMKCRKHRRVEKSTETSTKLWITYVWLSSSLEVYNRSDREEVPLPFSLSYKSTTLQNTKTSNHTTTTTFCGIPYREERKLLNWLYHLHCKEDLTGNPDWFQKFHNWTSVGIIPDILEIEK